MSVFGHMPSLGAAKFFQELDSSGASTKATAGQRPGGMFGRPGLPIREPDDYGLAPDRGGRGQSGSQQLELCAFPRQKNFPTPPLHPRGIWALTGACSGTDKPRQNLPRKIFTGVIPQAGRPGRKRPDDAWCHAGTCYLRPASMPVPSRIGGYGHPPPK